MQAGKPALHLEKYANHKGSLLGGDSARANALKKRLVQLDGKKILL